MRDNVTRGTIGEYEVISLSYLVSIHEAAVLLQT